MKTVVCGAGPVGVLAALYAAQEGHEVEIFEMRGDIAQEDKAASRQLGKSINLTMADRGLEALSHSGDPTLIDEVIERSTPAYAREIHGVDKNGDMASNKVQYHIGGKALRVISRGTLRDILLNRALEMPRIKVHFNRKLLHVDMDAKVLVFADSRLKDSYSEQRYLKVPFDLLIGADGAHSVVRHYMAKYENIDISQRWLDMWWCEFLIPRNKDGRPGVDLNALHIWPQKDIMFVALPNPNGTFNCNLFAPGSVLLHLKEHSARGDRIVDFFCKNFPGIVPNLITIEELVRQFAITTPCSLHEIRVSKVNFKNRCVLVGDAAHAMVPFYGQGLNTGLEDVRVLFQQHLSKIRDIRAFHHHLPKKDAGPLDDALPLLSIYSDTRQPDVNVMTTLALENYNEIRVCQKSVWKKFRRSIEETLQARCPNLGWCTLYARVAFSCQRFTSIQKDDDRQAYILGYASASLLLLSILIWVLITSMSIRVVKEGIYSIVRL